MRIPAQFIRSVVHADGYPKDGLPEIALAGRSNVGKSSLINRVLEHAGLAKTSNTPGRTQALNYYRIEARDEPSFYLVDMPGYGFAKVSKDRRAEWGQLIERYLHTRDTLAGIIMLVDLRHPPQPLDLQMAEWLHSRNTPFLLIGTKADKIARTKVPASLAQAASLLGVPLAEAIAFSAESGHGREEVWAWIIKMVHASET
jgi:GTP-binding protein